MKKRDLLREFSKDPGRYYQVDLFAEKGFERRRCQKCARYFWTLDPDCMVCPDDSPDVYSFIGDPPAARSLDYTEAWRRVESFFVGNGHTSVGRYPVVCRWRDDLFFTIASIVDFQRVMGSSIHFEFPANPLIIPQTCLRFKDLENVGVTGRHFSSFCMIGQHAIPEGGGYWKDRCVELDYELVTGGLGIDGREITFVEDVWAGGGSFGSSLEYFVRGLELGNAVFTEFAGEPGSQTVLDQRIIDMGAGLERFAWITSGTPTAYDCCFGPVIGDLFEAIGADPDAGVLAAYFTEIARLDQGNLHEARRDAARRAGITQDTVKRVIAPAESAYLIADHLRTLIFAIADGGLPSNVGGGYNLRMMLRRVISAASRIGAKLDVPGIVDSHIDYLKMTYPELDAARDDVKKILDIESRRYQESRSRMARIASKMEGRGRMPDVGELITLYESDGVTPDYLLEAGVISRVPDTFYTRLSELHRPADREDAVGFALDGLAETVPLYYGEDPAAFEARVLRVVGDMVVLDRTSFYPRGGGQEPDRGTVGGLEVTDVQVQGGVILHKLRGGVPSRGETVACRVDQKRRRGITQHHTATHVLNASAREILGSWVWQHSAFKEEDHARLDITHHSPLTEGEREKIEMAANGMIREDIPVRIENLDRGDAEGRYGFRIYQGGVVPVRTVRVVSIGDRDVEACGGTHVSSTGRIERVRITRAKRIQDGVVRLEFVAGEAAARYDRSVSEMKRKQKDDIEGRRLVLKRREDQKRAEQRDVPLILACISTCPEPRDPGRCRVITVAESECLVEEYGGGRTHRTGIERWRTKTGWFYATSQSAYGERFHIKIGRKIAEMEPGSTYCGLFQNGPSVRVIVHAGVGVGVGRSATVVAGAASRALGGGSGGGSAGFAQGGGRDTSKIDESLEEARRVAVG